MSESAVGVVGDPAVAERLRAAGAAVVVGTVNSVPATDCVVAVGQSAVSGVANAETEPVVLPVEAGRGVRSVARESVPAAIMALEQADIERHPVFAVTVDGSTVGTAVWDVTAVTAEAARISEYAVGTPTDVIGQFRADGVTVSTPAGSPGYARRIGGPVLTPSDSIGVIAPIAPFHTDPDNWVVALDYLTVSVERDEATVALYVDGDRASTVDCGESVTLSRSGTMRVAVVGESISRFV